MIPNAPSEMKNYKSEGSVTGQPMVLRCRIEAIPSAVIVWSKDDVNVEEWVINKDVVTQVHLSYLTRFLLPKATFFYLTSQNGQTP